MNKKLSLMAGTTLTVTLFFLFHAVLAIGTIAWIVALIPAVIIKCTLDDRKEAALQSATSRRDRA